MADEHKPEHDIQTPDPSHTEKQDHAPDGMTGSDGLAPPPDTSNHPNPNPPRSANASAVPSNAPSVAASVANNAINAPTQIVFTDPDFANPPDLNYGLRQRKKSIAIFWTLIILDCVAMPIALYFGLWYGTSLSHNAGECGTSGCARQGVRYLTRSSLQYFHRSTGNSFHRRIFYQIPSLVEKGFDLSCDWSATVLPGLVSLEPLGRLDGHHGGTHCVCRIPNPIITIRADN